MKKTFLSFAISCVTILGLACALTGCQSPAGSGASDKAIRINAGAAAPCTDSNGHTWLPDQGFVDGKSADRGNIEIAGTKNPAIYRTEHYGMAKFSMPVANGTYTVRLHFAETYAKITKKGERVFTVMVEDKAIKDLDVFARAGGPFKALVETLVVTVKDGKLDIIFTSGVQNPEINGIEILPK